MEQVEKIAIFGGGCFWCVEACFRRVKGVTNVIPGYCGGRKDYPTYYEVKSGSTGHAEVLIYDILNHRLLRFFMIQKSQIM